jgi:hypothetical protein
MQAGDGIARHFRNAAPPAAMINRDFYDPTSGSGRAHLHFEIPSIGWLSHMEQAQTVDAHGAEWRHVGKAHAIGDAQEQAGEPASDDLLRRHATRLASTAQARAHNEVCLIRRNRPHDGGQKIGNIAAVAIEKANDLGVGPHGIQSGRTGSTITALGLPHDPRARLGGPLRGSIG